MSDSPLIDSALVVDRPVTLTLHGGPGCGSAVDGPDALSQAVAPLRQALERASDDLVAATLSAVKASVARMAAAAEEGRASKAHMLAIQAVQSAADAHAKAVEVYGAPPPPPAS